MAKVSDFFASKHGKAVAARLSNTGNRLYYHQMDALGVVPPSVHLHAYMQEKNIQAKGKVMVNYLNAGGWINKNTQLENRFDIEEYRLTTYTGDPVPIVPDMSHWDQFSLEKLGAKPNLSSIYEETIAPSHSKARRIYMLATFCLLHRAGLRYRTKTLGHNIGSMLVTKTGEVLSWGVNTGNHRHAEVNTLISYFLRNPHETHLPAESVLFSTLKPCAMCSTFIKQAASADRTRVWYGMMDEGSSGSSPLLGKMSSTFTGGDIELDVFELMSAAGTLESAWVAKGTKPLKVLVGNSKVNLYEELNATSAKKGKMSAADWVDYSQDVFNLFHSALEKFNKKADKARQDGPVKNVLAYLKDFVRP